MPGKRCAVASCNNSRLKSKKEGLNISFHTFPNDKNRRNIWIRACRRKDKWNPNTSVICSDHFQADDFERDFRGVLMNIKTRRQLKSTAIPSVQLKSNKLQESPPLRKKREKRTKSGVVSEILQESKDTEENKLLQPSLRGRRREKRTKTAFVSETLKESKDMEENELLQPSSRGRRREKRMKTTCVSETLQESENTKNLDTVEGIEEHESLEDKFNDLLQKYNNLVKTNESQEQAIKALNEQLATIK